MERGWKFGTQQKVAFGKSFPAWLQHAEAIRRKRAEGKFRDQICRELHISTFVFTQAVKYLKTGEPPEKAKPIVAEYKKAAAEVQHLVEQGSTVVTAAAQLNITKDIAYRALQYARSSSKPRPVPLYKREALTALRLAEQGKSIAEIAGELGVSVGTVANAITYAQNHS